jgi:transcriptional regulator with XRE-family HTH domain
MARYKTKSLGETLKRLRKEKGYTQEKLAELAKIDPTTIIAIENARRNPTFITLSKLANALKVDVSELV